MQDCRTCSKAKDCDLVKFPEMTVNVKLQDTDLFTDICQLMKKFYDDIRLPADIKREFEIELKKIINKY